MQALTNLLLKIVNVLPAGLRGLLATDKWLHLFMGVLIGIVVCAAAFFLGLPLWYGAVAAAVLGALKEGRDYLINKEAMKNGLPPPHGVEALDFVFTGIGGGVPVVIATLALHLLGL